MNKQAPLSVCKYMLTSITSTFFTGLLVISSVQASAQNTVSLPWALEQTLLNNIQLQTFPYDLRIEEAQVLQAGITPNPELSLSIDNVFGTGETTGVDTTETTLVLSQLIELGDKRQRRIDFSLSTKQQQISDYELQRLSILSETTRRFYQLLRLQALKDWNQRRIRFEAQALKDIKARAKAGNVLQADVSKMTLELAHSRIALQNLTGQLITTKQRLASMWAKDVTFDSVEGALTLPSTYPTAASVLNAIETAPEYLKLLSVERVMQAKRRLEEAQGQYDINLGVGVRRFEDYDDTALVFSFSMPLNLTNPNQGNILAAKIAEDKVFQQQKLFRQQLRLTLLEIHQAMMNNANQAIRLKQELLPLAKQLLTDTQTAYQTGHATVLQLVDAQKELFSIEREIIEADTAVYLQRLELEHITGQAIPATTMASVNALEIK
ncbi:TolC family protein [Shewanella surugensis]|uniref:TolC family protein n=1 Tax=Shewanella surugensis TaxID=212020 RepID=A0ABT0L5H8_9GAMM|nr:TolC family protein [Shewanella surugensis]MCL1122936.1 TolC family protein [Shewanella surugensis]